MSQVVALLRGINVGGKNRVPMKELRETLTSLGYEDVRTYVQSGNVVFQPSSHDLGRLTAEIEQAIADAFGLQVTAVLRTAQELAKVAAAHPLAAPDTEPAKLHVVFLQAAAAPDRVASLDPDRSPPDRFEVAEREIYVLYPDGAARTKLTADYFERTLEVRATARNWNTVQKLREMAG